MLQVECGFIDKTELLVHFGPSISVQIGFDSSYRPKSSSKPKLPTNEYHALIDTGAQLNCIDSAVAAGLKLPIINEVSVSGAHGSGKVNVHLAQIHIPAFPYTIYGAFCGVHLHVGGQTHSALLGRTFLQSMKMTYEGNTGSVVLSYQPHRLPS